MTTVQAGHQFRQVGVRSDEKRSADRRAVAVPGRIIWKDRNGTTRMASVMTRDVSEQGVLLDCVSSCTIPLFRLVDLHVDRAARSRPELPAALKRPQVLAAVYRVGPYSQVTGTPQSYALRLLVTPERRTDASTDRIEPRTAPAETAARHTA